MNCEKYGHFDDARRRFVITDPRTPRPWVNYATNGRYSRLISHTGGGFAFHVSPRDGRITRWRYNALPQDRPGHCLYIRDRESGEVWSPTWNPVGLLPEVWRCEHAVNHTVWVAEHGGLSVRLTVFVDLEEDVELWLVDLENRSEAERKIDLFPWVELCLGHALTDLINQPNDKHFSDLHWVPDPGFLRATRRYWVTHRGATVKQQNQAWDRTVWMAASEPVAHFDGSLDAFIGPWRSESNPIAIERGRLGDTEITAGDPCAALQVPLTLAPGAAKSLAFQLGVIANTRAESDLCDLVSRFQDIGEVRERLRAVEQDAEDYLGGVQVQTPDADLDRMVNVWHQAQTRVTFLHGRDAGYYHGGLLFGRGFRDSCQDLMGPLIPRPQWVRARLLEMARRQFADGHCYHLYYPGAEGGEDVGHSDTPLWLPFAAAEYVRETGDSAVLEETTPFADGGEAPLADHLLRALDHVWETWRSPRGLMLIGPGDWNDPLDFCGRDMRGETAWGSMAFALVARSTAELLEHTGHPRAADLRARHAEIAEAINTHLWDGAWYIRATTDWGEKVGSAENSQGRIYLNAQTWAVMSGVAPAERARTALASAWEHLMTPKGPKLLHPPYTEIDEHIGLITRCVPGKKENGAVFNHPLSWAIVASLMIGDAERAHDIHRRALPFSDAVDIDRYEVEPYVQAEYVTSPDHETFGQASHSWLTGSAVWLLRGVLDRMLGIRPEFAGLRVDPCVPPGWGEWSVTRRFRGETYAVQLENPEGVSRGEVALEVDGTPVEGSLIAPHRDGVTHRVRAVLRPPR